jgi:hypothetical protein
LREIFTNIYKRLVITVGFLATDRSFAVSEASAAYVDMAVTLVGMTDEPGSRGKADYASPQS